MMLSTSRIIVYCVVSYISTLIQLIHMSNKIEVNIWRWLNDVSYGNSRSSLLLRKNSLKLYTWAPKPKYAWVEILHWTPSINVIQKIQSKFRKLIHGRRENPTDMHTKLVQNSKFMHCLDLLHGGMRSSMWASTVKRVFNARGRIIEFSLNTLHICVCCIVLYLSLAHLYYFLTTKSHLFCSTLRTQIHVLDKIEEKI
jgi:hypothetical protein